LATFADGPVPLFDLTEHAPTAANALLIVRAATAAYVPVRNAARAIERSPSLADADESAAPNAKMHGSIVLPDRHWAHSLLCVTNPSRRAVHSEKTNTKLSGFLQLDRFRSLAALIRFGFKRDAHALVQFANAGSLNGSNVDEDIVTPVIWFDKPITLLRVIELDRPGLAHAQSPGAFQLQLHRDYWRQGEEAEEAQQLPLMRTAPVEHPGAAALTQSSETRQRRRDGRF
jgi:hypothetical protein